MTMNLVCITNMEKREAQKDVEALIAKAVRCPSDEIRDQLIDQEVDLNGRFVGFDLSNAIWHRALDPLV